MFSKLVARNSRRARKENALFFSAMVISVMAFYIVLAMEDQDIMDFLREMESHAVSRLISMIPVFYVFTLVLLFFMVFYTSKMEMDRRGREFGLYLMMGMGRGRLFKMLVLEDLRNSIIALAMGLPLAVMVSEITSLVTVRLVGVGVVGHSFSLSWKAIILTVLGFLLIKGLASLILSGRVVAKEIGDLLAHVPDEGPAILSKPTYVYALGLGLALLGLAYYWAFTGLSWEGLLIMGATLFLGIAGTILIFYGLRFLISRMVGRGKQGKLHIYNFRQIQEAVVQKSTSLAVCSLLILAALIFFGTGVSFAGFTAKEDAHVVDYTFSGEGLTAEGVKKQLAQVGLEDHFQDLFEMHFDMASQEDGFEMDALIQGVGSLPKSKGREVLLNNLGFSTDYVHIVSLSGYNRLLEAVGDKPLVLEPGQVAFYSGDGSPQTLVCLDKVIQKDLTISLGGQPHQVVGPTQTQKLVTDRSIWILFGFILPDQDFEAYLQKYGASYVNGVYVNGILNPDLVADQGLMLAVMETNDKVDQTGLQYESYLQNMGRQLFYGVAISYITLYLAIIFMVIANTIIGVQFLMGQEKTHHRFKVLTHLGASYKDLCRSADKQVHWYFGLPLAMAIISSLIGIRSLMIALMPSTFAGDLSSMVLVAGLTLLVLLLVELLYMTLVKRMSRRRIATWMQPRRLD